MRPNAICRIVPPHMIEAMARAGEPGALRSLAVSERIRGGREALGALAMAAAVPAGRKRRSVYDARSGTRLPGRLARGEGDGRTGDAATDEAYDGSGAVHDFFRAAFGRLSLDGRGMRLDSSVHYGVRYDNAFWDGRQMVYGDGDGAYFARFTRALSVVAHELTHGVTQFEAGLAYEGQSGALNESFSDVFGVLSVQWKRRQTAAKADWLIGKEILGPKFRGTALRSLAAPGTAYDDPVVGRDPQPSHMRAYVETEDDNGGVHINSGIPNHAFYLAATAIGGRAWEKAGRIWYAALANRLRPESQFKDAALATVAAARELFGARGREQAAVRAAWRKVGVG